MNSLLLDPILQVELDSGPTAMTLPGLLAALCGDEVVGLSGLQAHQEHAVYAFLAQLGAMALWQAQEETGPAEEGAWRAHLLALSRGQASAWELAVSDARAPAFLQPPLPEGQVEVLKNVLHTPDELDLLVTAKNHDLKMARATSGSAERWVYALITLQTMQGFSGRGNYGVARMNSGFGNRPGVALLPSLRWGRRFLEDVALLTDGGPRVTEKGEKGVRTAACSDHGFAEEGGLGLLWLEPWDGRSSLPMSRLDPWCIEICRRVRLERHGERLSARMGATEAPRLDGRERAGVLGDPWTPIDQSDADALSALTVGAQGFTYKLLHRMLLRADFQLPPAVDLERAGLIHAVALARGQGKTEGLHERWVPHPRGLWGSELERARELAERRIGLVGDVKRKVLYPAIKALLNGGSLDSRRDERPSRWCDAFEQELDDTFFPDLWRDLEPGVSLDEAARRYEEQLRDGARRWLERAIEEAPGSEARRWRSMAAAESILHSQLRKIFGPTSTKESDHVEP